MGSPFPPQKGPHPAVPPRASPSSLSPRPTPTPAPIPIRILILMFTSVESRRRRMAAIPTCWSPLCLDPGRRIRLIRFSNCWADVERSWKRERERRRRPLETSGSIGGNDKIFQQKFGLLTREQLRKSFTCYILTSSGPVIRTLYVSARRLAFCIHYTAQGQPQWIYYKVVVQLDQLRAVNLSANIRNPADCNCRQPWVLVHGMTKPSRL